MRVSSRGVGRLILGISFHPHANTTALSLQILVIRVSLELGSSPHDEQISRSRGEPEITFSSPFFLREVTPQSPRIPSMAQISMATEK